MANRATVYFGAGNTPLMSPPVMVSQRERSVSGSSLYSPADSKRAELGGNDGLVYDDSEYSELLLESNPNSRRGSKQRGTTSTKEDKKLAHSAMERRYRQELNNYISELKSMVPACATTSNLNKVAVLKLSAEYIQQVHENKLAGGNTRESILLRIAEQREQLRQQQKVVEELQMMMENLKKQLDVLSTPMTFAMAEPNMNTVIGEMTNFNFTNALSPSPESSLMPASQPYLDSFAKPESEFNEYSESLHPDDVTVFSHGEFNPLEQSDMLWTNNSEQIKHRQSRTS